MSMNIASLVKIPCNLLKLSSENVWKQNDGGTDNNPKPDLDNINGQITILNQILLISMHIQVWLKGLVIYSSYCLETKIWACLGQITP